MRALTLAFVITACGGHQPPPAPLSNTSTANPVPTALPPGCTMHGTLYDLHLREPMIGGTLVFDGGTEQEDVTISDDQGAFTQSVHPGHTRLVVYFNDTAGEYKVDVTMCGRRLRVTFDDRAKTQPPLVVE
jgi:hypothetical protein